MVESQEVVDVLHFKNEWLHNELHVNPNELRLLFADGESMEPSIRSGDILLVNVSDQRVRIDGIYVLRLDGVLLVKRLQRLPGNVIKVSSDNAVYGPYEITADTLDDFAVIGPVVWVGKRI